MTRKFTNLLALTLAVLLYNCSSKSEKNEENKSNPEAAISKEIKTEITPAVCIWDNISVRESAGAKGKYITALSLGESLNYLGKDSLIDKREYANVTLNDGVEGWALKDFIVNNAKAAVVLADISLYDRPDLLTKSEKTFKMMDIIASVEEKGDWMKIKGRISGAKWISEGWVKSKNISFESIDIAGAKFALEALSIEDDMEKNEAIKNIINNADLAGSKFILELEAMISKSESVEKEVELSSENVEADSLEVDIEVVKSDSI